MSFKKGPRVSTSATRSIQKHPIAHKNPIDANQKVSRETPLP